MNLRHWIRVLGVCLGLSTPAALFGMGAQQQKQQSQSTPPDRASSVLAIESSGGFEPRGRQIDVRTITAMFTSTSLIDPAAQDVLGLGPREWPKVALVEVTPSGDASIKLTVTLLPSAEHVKGDARTLMDEIIRRGQESVAQLGRAEPDVAPRAEQISAELTRVQKEISVVRSQRVATEESLRSLSHTGSRVPTEMSRLKTEHEIAERRVRIAALEAALNERRAALQPLIEALQKTVEQRRQLIAVLQKAIENGKVSDLEVSRALADLSDAEARLAALQAPSEGSPTGSIAHQLTHQKIELAVAEARLAQFSAPATTQPMSSEELMQRLNELMHEEQRLNTESANLRNELERLRRASADRPSGVRLVVLGRPSSDSNR